MMSFTLKRLRPQETGLRAALPDLEAAVMEVVWAHLPRAFTVRDVLHHLEATREIAYTTVMTTVDRLAQKGLLSRETSGKAYVYRAATGREAFLDAVARQMAAAAPAMGRASALSFLVELVGDADPEELDRLQRLIDERRRQLGGA
ncbi:BlaI/MecI/CopY family transcriptional regulator [Myxococcota bacterium]|nr:BlaI/MecI/CopY family transcriptional regulator [Myxococcota bacterium]